MSSGRSFGCVDRRLEPHRFGRRDIRRTIDDEAERAFWRVLAQQHHRLGEVRVDELGHGEQQCRCERHDFILPDCKVHAHAPRGAAAARRAQAMASATISSPADGCAASASSATAASAGGSCAAAYASVRRMRRSPARRSALPFKSRRQSSSDRPQRSTSDGKRMASRGCHAGSALATLRRFHGHTSWQMSHPTISRGDGRTQRLVDRAARLDREIRHAARRIDDVRLGDGAGWARVETARARAALIDAGAVGLELGAREHFRQEQPRPERRVDEARVLADPAEARLLGEHPLLHGPVVDARKRLDPAARRLVHPSHERGQARADHVVIVLAPRVARDDRAGRARRRRSNTAGRCCRRQASEMTDRAVGSTRRGSSRSSRDLAR